MRRPTDSLNCSDMLGESNKRLLTLDVPDVKFIVIASRGELLIIKTPFQATDFLLMLVIL